MHVNSAIENMTINKMLLKVEQKIANILLMSNSSTTRLLEVITGQDIEINVVNQEIVSRNELGDEYNTMLENSNSYLKRIVSLHCNGKILSDNIVIASIDSISDQVKEGLLESKIPLGKLIGDQETKRELLWTGYVNKINLQADFVERKFSLTHYPAKKYLIYINGCCWFYLLEVFHTDEILKLFWH